MKHVNAIQHITEFVLEDRDAVSMDALVAMGNALRKTLESIGRSRDEVTE